LDLVGCVVKVLEGDLGRVQEGVYSLHFSAAGLHSYLQTLVAQGSRERKEHCV